MVLVGTRVGDQNLPLSSSGLRLHFIDSPPNPPKKSTPGEGMYPVPVRVFSHANWHTALPTWKAQGNLWAPES